MNLADGPFKAIKAKTKTIEMRLNDERRKDIKKGDQIIFHHNDTFETLSCVVLSIKKYSNFIELYKHYNKISIGYNDNEDAKPDDMLKYYSQEQIEKNGVLAIEIKCI